MNIKSWFHPSPPPRILLIYPAILVMLLAMLAGALALTYDNNALAVVGIVLGLLWLGLLALVALPHTDRWLAGMQSWFKPLAATIMFFLVFAGVVEMLALVATGLGTTGGGILGDSTPKLLAYISHDLSSSDAVALLDQAVDNVFDGKNPYAHSNVVSAVINMDSPYDKTTPLRLGRFAGDFPYPTSAEIHSLWNEAVKTPDIVPVELESKLGYPSGFFLIPALFSFLGVDNIRVIYLLLVVAALAAAIGLAPSRLRLWLAGACLGSLVIWNGIASGLTGSLYFPFLLLAWVLWRRNLWVSAICMGIAVATKQVVWFFLPFYLILLARQLSWRQAAYGAGLVAGVFAAFNLPFIIAGPYLWFDSVVSMMKDALFPSGWGIITLVLQGWVNIESPLLFTIMEATVLIAAVIWYWRNARKYPYLGVLLPVLPLFFDWRSLWTYFLYIDIILLAAVMQEYAEKREPQTFPTMTVNPS
jgi:hypothetical protein